MEIYITKDGKESGPYTKDQVESLHLAGMVHLSDHVWHEGMLDWEPLHRFLGVRPPAPGAVPATHAVPEPTFSKPSRDGSGWKFVFTLLVVVLIGVGGWFGYKEWNGRGVMMAMNRATWAVSDRSDAGGVSYLESIFARQEAGIDSPRDEQMAERLSAGMHQKVASGRAVFLSKGTKVRKLKDQDANSLVRLEDERTVGTYWIPRAFIDEIR
jgi:hypothetical protein